MNGGKIHYGKKEYRLEQLRLRLRTDRLIVMYLKFKDGAWDAGELTTDPNVTLNECAGVFQYAQTVFEGMKAYTTEDGHIVTFRPDLNAERMANSAKRLEMLYSRKTVLLMQLFRL